MSSKTRDIELHAAAVAPLVTAVWDTSMRKKCVGGIGCLTCMSMSRRHGEARRVSLATGRDLVAINPLLRRATVALMGPCVICCSPRNILGAVSVPSTLP